MLSCFSQTFLNDVPSELHFYVSLTFIAATARGHVPDLPNRLKMRFAGEKHQKCHQQFLYQYKTGKNYNMLAKCSDFKKTS